MKNSLAKLIELLTPLPAGVYEDLVSHTFSLADVRKPGLRFKKRGKRTPAGTTTPPPAAPVIAATPKWYNVTQTAAGFRIRGSNAAPFPPGGRLRVRAAYDVPDGNPFTEWSRFDFVFSDGPTNPVKLDAEGATVRYQKNESGHGTNRFFLDVQRPDFSVRVSGFDPIRDLIVRCDEVATAAAAAAAAADQQDEDEAGSRPAGANAGAPRGDTAATPAAAVPLESALAREGGRA